MNEVKKQLNKKMGDTKERSQKIIMNVEQQKHQQTSKKKSSFVYYVTFVSFAVLLGLFFMLNPFQVNIPVTAPTPNVGTSEEPLTEDGILNLKSFFKQDGDVAYFIGDNLTFADFTETTTWLNDDYVQLITNTGGMLNREIYKVTAEKIELVLEDRPEINNIDVPSIKMLETLIPISTLLEHPIEDGNTFENKIITYPVELKTPYRTFNEAIQVTLTDETSTIDYYYSNNFGLIGKVETFEDGYPVTSLIASINTEPPVDENAKIQVFNKTTNQLETLPFRPFAQFDQLLIYKPEIDSAVSTYEVIHKTADAELGAVDMRYGNNYIVALVLQSGGTTEVMSGSNSDSVDWQYSPNKQLMAFRFSSENKKGNSNPNGSLFVFDLNEMKFITLYTHDEITLYMPPIYSYKWLDNATIEYLVPDIDVRESDILQQWQQSDEKPTRPIIGLL